ncbi:MAG: hypothetical protein ACLFOY_14660 [Desulfatibacillaceae bacterium]
MDANEYCTQVHRQLTGLKAGLYDVMQRVDSLPTDERNQFQNQVDTLKKLTSELDDGLEQLRTACPADWSPNKKEMDARLKELRSTLETIGQKTGVSIPDTLAWV